MIQNHSMNWLYKFINWTNIFYKPIKECQSLWEILTNIFYTPIKGCQSSWELQVWLYSHTSCNHCPSYNSLIPIMTELSHEFSLPNMWFGEWEGDRGYFLFWQPLLNSSNSNLRHQVNGTMVCCIIIYI